VAHARSQYAPRLKTRVATAHERRPPFDTSLGRPASKNAVATPRAMVGVTECAAISRGVGRDPLPPAEFFFCGVKQRRTGADRCVQRVGSRPENSCLFFFCPESCAICICRMKHSPEDRRYCRNQDTMPAARFRTGPHWAACAPQHNLTDSSQNAK